EIEGVATTVPADIAILDHPDFQAVEHSTKWVEDELDLSAIAPPAPTTPEGEEDDPKVRRDVDVEVNGKRFKVAMWVPESDLAASAKGGGGPKPKRRSAARAASTGSGSGDVTVPMQGTVVKVLVEPGQEIEAGETVIVLEAMKMENNVVAEKSGKVAEIKVAAGDSVSGGDVVATIE
ncbi:MAG: carbamoyl phosphate synthase, partial [Actinomycetia bacterium]|nr:carbamoyl phosphate synthase [Actinomycetes bacterium]